MEKAAVSPCSYKIVRTEYPSVKKLQDTAVILNVSNTFPRVSMQGDSGDV